jgi:hypothetical protein
MKRVKVVVGIDPGPDEHGIVVLVDNKVRQKVNLRTDSAIDCLVDIHYRHIAVIACEIIESYGMPVGRSTFQTCIRIGEIYREIPTMRLIPRKDVKMHLCGTVRAKDANVRQALIDIYGPKGTSKNRGQTYGFNNHLWAALAVADTASKLQQTINEWNLEREHAS